MADDSDQPFTHADWTHWITQVVGPNRPQQWTSDRLAEAPILQHVPPHVLQATTTRPPQAPGDFVAVKRPGREAVIGVVDLANNIQKVFLDASGFHHLTGKQLTPRPQDKVSPVATWRHLNRQYQEPYAREDEDEDPPEKVVTTILGPVAGAFPLNEGWYMKGQTPRKLQIDKDFGDDLRRLSDLTIHEITVHLTKRYVGNDRPSCETNWLTTRHKLPPQPQIPWKQVWASVGTDLSDPTEEADWRKLLLAGQL